VGENAEEKVEEKAEEKAEDSPNWWHKYPQQRMSVHGNTTTKTPWNVFMPAST